MADTHPKLTLNASGSLAQSKITYLNGTTSTEISSTTVTALTLVSKTSTITKGYYGEDRSITVRDASGLTFNIEDKASDIITVSGDDSSGYYSLSTGLTGTLLVNTSDWFTSKSLTDSTVTVGRITKASFKLDQTGEPSPKGTASRYELTAIAGYVAESVASSIPVYNDECA